MKGKDKTYSWEDITVADWYEIQDIYAIKEKGLSKKKQDFKNHLRVYAYVMDVEFDYLWNLPSRECDLLREPYRFLDTPVSVSKKIKEWNGLTVCYDPKDTSAGQFIDMMEISKSGDHKLHRAVATLLRGWKIDDFDERADYVLNVMPITIAISINSFFLPRLNVFLRLFPRFLRLAAKAQMRKIRMQRRWKRLKATLSGSTG